MYQKIVTPLAVIVGLMVLCVVGRLMPHAPNFTPVAAVALFASALFRSRVTGIAIATVAMLISDLVIGGYDWRIMVCVYASVLLPALLGRSALGRFSAVRVAGSATASSLVFFIASNFGVWLFGGSYAASLAGLGECYAAALPFFRYTLAGDLFWSGALFGAYALFAAAARGTQRDALAAPAPTFVVAA